MLDTSKGFEAGMGWTMAVAVPAVMVVLVEHAPPGLATLKVASGVEL